jgi:YD repeat-containing protein
MKNKILHYVIISIFLSAVNLNAGVNLKNGNFYISYTDQKIESPGYGLIEIERTYNSKSTYAGIFGFGWSSEFETYLKSYPDASVMLQHYGGGRSDYFESPFISAESISFMVDELVRVSIEAGELENEPYTVMEYRQKTTSNAEFRCLQWDKFVELDKLEYSNEIPVGMSWKYLENGLLTRSDEGFNLEYGSKISTFDLQGKLIKIEKSIGKSIQLYYRNKQLEKIVSADGYTISFSFNEEGFVSEIKSNQGSSYYKYFDRNLIESIDVQHNLYQHSYDKVHNMIGIGYKDGTQMSIQYDPVTFFCSKVVNRDGSVSSYEYVSFYTPDGNKDDNHYATKVAKSTVEAKSTVNYYEYLIKVRPNGSRYTYMIITEVDGYRKTVFFDELCEFYGQILYEEKDLKFTYNDDCLLSEVFINKDERYFIEYLNSKLINRITNNKSNDLKFTYDANGNLTGINLSDHESIIWDYENKVVANSPSPEVDKITSLIIDILRKFKEAASKSNQPILLPAIFDF